MNDRLSGKVLVLVIRHLNSKTNSHANANIIFFTDSRVTPITIGYTYQKLRIYIATRFLYYEAVLAFGG